MARRKEPERVEINKARIVDAARELFLKNGYEGTRMDDILAKAGMSRSTLYIYFRSKEEIKNYISLEAMEYFHERLKEQLTKNSNEYYKVYLDICNTLVDFKDRYPLNFKLIIENISVDESDLESSEVLRKIYETGEAVNKLITDRLMKNIALNNTDLLQIIFTMWGSLYGLITLADNKEAYIGKSMGLSKNEFLNQGFEKLFLIMKEGAIL